MRRFLTLLVLLPFLAACGGGSDDEPGGGGGNGGDDDEVLIDADEFGERVTQRVREATGADTDVSCRNDREPAVERMIVTCEVSAGEGQTTVANVTITGVDPENDASPITADIDVPIVPTAEIEADVAEQLRAQIGEFRADCPAIVPVSDRLDFECPIVEPADAEGVVVSVTGPPDDLRYRTVRG